MQHLHSTAALQLTPTSCESLLLQYKLYNLLLQRSMCFIIHDRESLLTYHVSLLRCLQLLQLELLQQQLLLPHTAGVSSSSSSSATSTCWAPLLLLLLSVLRASAKELCCCTKTPTIEPQPAALLLLLLLIVASHKHSKCR
jgi:hypothetical protein